MNTDIRVSSTSLGFEMTMSACGTPLAAKFVAKEEAKEKQLLGGQIKLFRLFGFTVKADASWFIILAFLIWTLGSAYFPYNYPELATSSYLLLGLLGTLGLFGSIVVHEFSHALVARHYGIPMEGITLWVFGGVAEMSEEPKEAKHEFLMAGAGPITSFAIAGLCYVLATAIPGNSPFVNGVLVYLWQINLILAIFNLIPAFPLDGGRILRSLLWSWKGQLKWATRISANIGSGFGIALILLGVLGFVSGNFVGGIWYLLIGLFIRYAAKMSYLKLRITESLQGEPIGKFMSPIPTINADATVEEVINHYVFRKQLTSFAIVDASGEFKGILGMSSLKSVPQAKRSSTTVSQVAEPPTKENSVDVTTDSADLYGRMHARNRSSHIAVLQDGKPVGIVSQSLLLKLVSLKLQLSGDEDDVPPDMRLPEAG